MASEIFAVDSVYKAKNLDDFVESKMCLFQETGETILKRIKSNVEIKCEISLTIKRKIATQAHGLLQLNEAPSFFGTYFVVIAHYLF